MTVVVVTDLSTGATIERELGSVVGSGAYRTVFEFGHRMVAKQARGRFVANETELDIWQDVKNTDAARYLCPVIAASENRSIIVQPRMENVVQNVARELEDGFYRSLCECQSDEQEREVSEEYRENVQELNETVSVFVRDVQQAMRAVGYTAYDLHEGNIGIDVDGTYKVIDYGNFRKDVRYVQPEQCSCGACNK